MSRSAFGFALLALVLWLPSSASAQYYGGDASLDPSEIVLPTKAFQNGDGITYGTLPDSVEPIQNVSVPFQDQDGKNWVIKVNVVTRRFDLYQANGMMVKTGFLSAEHVFVFKEVAEQRRLSHKYPGIDQLQPYPVAQLVQFIIDLMIAWGFSTPEDTTGPQVLDQLGVMCAADAARETSQSMAMASISCPSEPRMNANGRMCISRPAYSAASPGDCRGVGYSGICIRECY